MSKCIWISMYNRKYCRIDQQKEPVRVGSTNCLKCANFMTAKTGVLLCRNNESEIIDEDKLTNAEKFVLRIK